MSEMSEAPQPVQPEAAKPTAMPTTETGQRPGMSGAEQSLTLNALAPEQSQQETKFRLPEDMRELLAMPVIRSQEQWQQMDAWDMRQAIEYGKITDARALLTFANKQQAEELRLAKDDAARAAIEARYRPLIEGDRQALANYCLDQGKLHSDYCRDRAEVDIAFHRAHPDQTMFNVSGSIKGV